MLVLMVAGLPACATPPSEPLPRPEPIVRTVETKVPVRMPCEVADVPTRLHSFDTAKTVMAIDDKVKLLLADRIEREAEARELRAALDGCRH